MGDKKESIYEKTLRTHYPNNSSLNNIILGGKWIKRNWLQKEKPIMVHIN